jgi:hypothetical protein
MNTRTQWVLTMHFGRGHNQVFNFDSKAAALECIRTAVFTNEDCINFSCYREEVKMSPALEKLAELERMMEMRDRILGKMNKTLDDVFQQNRKEWAK